MLLTKLPTYLYHHEELPQRGDGSLFHFTKYDSFLKILEDMTFLPSSFGQLNDMNEGNVNNMDMNENFIVMYEAKRFISERCRLLLRIINIRENKTRIILVFIGINDYFCKLKKNSKYVHLR